MEILILGGTKFIGPHIVETATSRGHRVTLFNRGRTDPDRFADLDQLRGDREEGDYESLEGGDWDAVVDTSAYYPRAVREALEVLEPIVDHYVLISTVSVYRDFDADTIDEEYPFDDPDDLEDPTTEEIDADTYGPLKVACERRARDLGPGRVTVLRPPVIAGPGDSTDRFTYWPVRVADAGSERVLAPGDPDWSVQYLDARDLADWILETLEERITGTFNTALPRDRATWGEFLDICREVSGSEANFEWIDGTTLKEAGVEAWKDLPIWAPPGSSLRGLAGISPRRARDAGITFRSVETTVADTLKWFHRERGADRSHLDAGLSAEREAELLAQYAPP